MIADDYAVYDTLNPNLGFFRVGGKLDLPVPYSLICESSTLTLFCMESSKEIYLEKLKASFFFFYFYYYLTDDFFFP